MHRIVTLVSQGTESLEHHTGWEPPGGSGVYRRRLLLWRNFTNRRRRCKILLVLDGQAFFAFGQPESRQHWRAEERLKKCSSPLVVCAIPASQKRYEEYVGWSLEPGHYSPSGARHAQFLVEAVLPYLTTYFPRAELSGLIGSSAGGVAALYAGWSNPSVYPALACLSAGRHYFRELLNRFEGLPAPRVYLSCGDRGMDRGFVQENKFFANRLKARGCEVTLHLHQGEHCETVWGRRIPSLLNHFL